jgi:hopanoid biosynthesis associated protein HpnK
MLAPHLIPGLVDRTGIMNDRMFVNAVRFFSSSRLRGQLEGEIRAQFSAFAKTGLELDHVNVHKHFHLHPTLFGMLLRIGRDFGMRAVRVPDEPLWFATRAGHWSAGASAVLLKPWTALMKRRLRRAGLVHNDSIFGLAASGHMDEAKLLMVLQRLPPGVTEIYLHPAVQSGPAIALSMTEYRHADELTALLSPRVRAAIALGACGHGGYADLMRARVSLRRSDRAL